MANAFKLNNGLLLLSTEAPGGVYNSTQLKKVAALADGETAVIKATEDQRLALFVKEAAVAKVTQELQSVGLGVRHYQDGLHQPVNCLGELCTEHAQDAMGASMDIAQELKKFDLSSALKIGINGCGRCCVATHTLDISIVGDSGGYRISLGGKNSQIPEMASFMAEGVPAAKLPKLVAKVIAVYKELAEKGESLQELMERSGSKRFIEALAPYSQDAAQADPFGGVSEPSAATEDSLSADVGPTIDDDLGTVEVTEPDIAPDFNDVGPESEEDLGLSPEDELVFGEDSSGNLSAEVPIASDEDLGDSSTAAIGDLSVETDDELILESTAPTGDELVLEDASAASTLPEMTDDNDTTLLHEETSSDLGEMDEEIALDSTDVGELPEVEAAPATQVASAAASPASEAESEFESEIGADEVAEDEADAFEAKLNESIAEEEQMPEIEDVNSGERMEAVRLVEQTAELPSVDTVPDSLNTDESFDDLEIDDEIEPEIMLEDEVAPVSQDAIPRVSSSHGFDFAGVDVMADGRISVMFSSGANVSIDPRSLDSSGRKDLIMGGKKVSLKSGAKGISVEVDGVEIFLPRRAA